VRIVGGQFRGRPLAVPSGEAIRPTSDRVRESVFNILQHGIPDFTLDGAKVLDLFAGTGALGIEALSRGAGFCLFVEEDAEARGLVRRNVEAFGLTGVTKIFRRDATSLGPAGNLGGLTLAFLDPPYGKGLAERALASAAEGRWLAPGAVAVIEERKGAPVVLPAGFAQLDQRTWGDTEVVFARFATSAGTAPARA
jgi:16S rRNA (guanine966-N2)-methyltransferase